MTTQTILGVALATVIGTGLASAQLINGAGATFPYPIYSKWFDSYHKQFPNLQFNYQSIGSGGGVKQITEGTVDFGASDNPMSDKLLAAYKAKRQNSVLHFPSVLGAVVIAYNLPNVPQQLNLSGELLAAIFLGRVWKWNDPEMVKMNPGVKLPDATIVVIHRSDGSGTTFILSDYLSKVSKEWEAKVGRASSVKWPTGLGGKGSEGVTGQVKQIPNSLGYTELIFAVQTRTPFAKMRNASGALIQADLKSVTEAAASSEGLPDDFRASITNAPGKGAYPISSFTWLLIPDRIQDPAKRNAVKSFLKWMLTDGQDMTEALNFSRLPKAVIAKELRLIEKIQ